MQSTEQNFPTISEPSAKEDTSSVAKEESESDTETKVEQNNSYDSIRIRERTPSVVIHDVSFEKKITPRSKSPVFGENADYSQEKLSPRIPVEVVQNETNSKKDETFDEESSSNASSDSDDSDSDSDVENLPIEEQLEREKVKSARANETIGALLQQITQYKTAIEGEQAALENQVKEERTRWKKEEKALKNQVAKLDKQVDNLNLVLSQTAAHYESKLQELEEEKTTRSKETIENLQTLIRELNYIEEVNEDLTRQLERETNSKKNLQEELQTSKQLIDQLTAKVSGLEEENLAMSSKHGKGFREVMHLVSPRGHPNNSVSPASPGKDSDASGIALELNKVKLLYAQALQDLEKERTKVQSIDLLVNQIKIITAPSVTSDFSSNQSGEAEEKRVLLKKLLEEKEAHSSTLQTLNDERRKSQNDREYMESLSQRIKDLIQSHSNTLKQLEEERDNVRKGKEIVKELQSEIKGLKSEKKGKLLILSSLETDGGIEVSPLMSEEDDNKTPTSQSAPKTLPSTSDSESSGKNSPTVKSRSFVPDLRLENAGPDVKPLRPGIKSKFPPVGNRPAFFSLRHKKSHSTGYFPEYSDDNDASNFDLSDLPQSVSGARIRATLRKYMKQQKEEDLATPDIRTPDVRTPEVRSPRTPRDGPESPREKLDTRPRDGSMTERSDRDKSRPRKRSSSRATAPIPTKDDSSKVKSSMLTVPKLNIPVLDEKEKQQQQLRLAQSAREPSSDERTENFRPKLTKGKYESEPKLTYTPRKDNPFLDLINEREKEKKKKKEKKSKKEKLTRPERKGSIGSASVDSMPNATLNSAPINRMRRNTMDKKLWAQMLSSGFY